MHFSWQLNYWSLRCSWSIAYRRCPNYIFIIHLILGVNILQQERQGRWVVSADRISIEHIQWDQAN